MSLIICPECKKQVSDKASVCIHCGFPISEMKQSAIFAVVLDGFSCYENELLKTKLDAMQTISNLCNLINSDAIKIINNAPNSVVADGLSKESAEYVSEQLTKAKCIVKIVDSDKDALSDLDQKIYRIINKIEEPLMCPRCHSTSVSVGRRGFSIITGFIGANKTVNRCGKCGLTWTPIKS